MATNIIKFTLLQNLSVGDVITYCFRKDDGTLIQYANSVTQPRFVGANNTSAISNLGIGATKEQTMENWYNMLIAYNYNYIGLTYTYSDNTLEIELSDADGYDHIYNKINVPAGKMIVETDKPCDASVIYNNDLLNNYAGPLKISEDGGTFGLITAPNEFDARINRDVTYLYSATTFTQTINIPIQLNVLDVELTRLNTSLTVILPPYASNYTNYWFKLNDQDYQTSRILNGLVEGDNTIYIKDIWGCEKSIDYNVTSLDYGFINFPQVLTPVYNPVMYNFLLPNFNDTGFRYLINVENAITNEIIYKGKITPQIDGSGYIDLSKVLSNFTTFDFNKDNIFTDNASKSYIKYNVNLGYEYNQNWQYLSYSSATVNGIQYTILSGDTAHTYAVDDNVVIETLNGLTEPLNGLHKVIAVGINTITIDVPYVGTSPSPIGGIVNYADNRKTKYNNVYSYQNQYAWNGVLSWKDFKEYFYDRYMIEYASASQYSRLLTSLLPYTNDYDYPKYYAIDNQDFWINVFTDRNDRELLVQFTDDQGNPVTYTIDNGTPYGNMRQFKVNIKQIIGDLASDNTEYIDFKVFDSDFNETFSLPYRIYVDRRCRIEDYQILFLDRLGSLLSFAFQLRTNEKGTVERETFKQHVDYVLGTTGDIGYDNVDLAAQGTTTYHVGLYKEFELNTNWMTDAMSVLFEELVTSPNTWIKIDGEYYACTVQEKSFEVTRQKNKTLIRKTVTVRLANDSIINI